MNKIKLIYDVVKTMKDKEVFKGTLKVEGIKDQSKIFGFDNTFEKNNATGQTKSKTCTEIEYEGKKMKMENSIDSDMPGCHGHGPHGFFKHFHHNHDFGMPDCRKGDRNEVFHSMRHHHEFQHHGTHSGGIKGGLNRAAMVLGLLDSLNIDELEDKSVILSLDMQNVPEDLKKLINEKMEQDGKYHEHIHEGHDHSMFMKELHSMEKTDFNLKIYINGNHEVEKTELEVKGMQKDDQGNGHDMKITAELGLDW